jgi:excisionase family DNA binding protein
MTGALLKIDEVAGLLGCSRRTVRRLVATGQMPAPLRIGSLIRWPKEVIETWIARGCPPGG